jgi:uncharacterized protein YfaS (alpha-2-macroglobulin family)
VDSKYFFGGPVSNATLDYGVVSNPYFFNYTGKDYYDFIDYDYDAGPGEFYGTSRGLIASGTLTTDERGLATIEVPADLEDATQSQTFTVEATVTDESQQAVSGRTDVIVHQGLVYIGARPEDYVSTAGKEAVINLIAVDWESNGAQSGYRHRRFSSGAGRACRRKTSLTHDGTGGRETRYDGQRRHRCRR